MLSCEQNKIGRQINATTARETHNMIKKHESSQLTKQIEDTEESKNNSTRMYKSHKMIRNIYRDKPESNNLCLALEKRVSKNYRLIQTDVQQRKSKLKWVKLNTPK